MGVLLNHLSLTEASEALQKKDISSEELTHVCLGAIKENDPEIHAFLTVTEEQALMTAREVDRARSAGEPLDVLAGIPFAVKDILATKGIRTTAASKILEDYVPPYDATVIERLKKKRIVILGKTNLDEFAHGASTEHSAYGPTRNPLDMTRVPGGSSGGSAAALAAHECIAALGTDTGGSIRQPAAFCGVVGVKPSYGRVSRYGLLSMTSSTDVVGPMTKTVMDAAIVLEAIAGEDGRDGTTVSKPVLNYRSYLEHASVQGMRIGVPKEYFVPGMEKEVEERVRAALATYEKLGATLVDISLPNTEYAVPVYYITTPSEISSNLARYDGIRYGYSVEGQMSNVKCQNLEEVYALSRAGGFGPEAKRRIMIGTYALSHGYYDAYYLQAAKVRTLLRRDFEAAFKNVDVIMTPTSPNTAFKIGEKTGDPLALYLEDIFVTAVSMAGLPAVSIPCGIGAHDMPVGLQIIGNYFEEEKMLSAAYVYEQTKPQ
ncbi:Asp-tRNA(Asn)/Glu-tRNA(Gln) amidotransferase subunit GatA [Candidatus Uhrbacteria bacterium]|nr:Asp-tRNA(Asn)/Glu-tRNA(Gln) amidotransferase subunit GatA [Candidatus Uhrbacteria bacterium]